MVLGRAVELKYLNTYYDREGSQIMVVYGEKNIGKTALLSQFVQDKPFHYYRARSASEREQRYQWGKELSKEEVKTLKYPSFTEILQSLMKNHKGKKVIIIDEFQYIVKASEGFIGELVNFAHSGWQNSEVMVILCSSSIGWVENSMITKIGSAAYELSGFLKIKELDFEFMMEYFPGFGMEKSIEAYAVLGGVPGLWKHFNDKISIKENICRNILDPAKYLYGEGQRIVERELRETGVYNTILASIAAGNHKLNDLYLHTEFSRAKISVYLKNLMEIDVIEKVDSFETGGARNTQKGLYQIRDHFVNFWFRFIYPHLSDLYMLKPEEFYDLYIAPDIDEYMNRYFVRVCVEYMELMNRVDKLPIKVVKLGTWIGKQGTVDIVAQDAVRNTIVGSCNWSKPMMTAADVAGLAQTLKKARLSPKHIFLFTATEFAPEGLALTDKDERFVPIDMKEL